LPPEITETGVRLLYELNKKEKTLQCHLETVRTARLEWHKGHAIG
jgi:hypothetical protein